MLELVNKIKLNWKSAALAGAGVLVVIFLLMPQQKKQSTQDTIKTIVTEPSPPAEFETPTEIKWIIEDKQLPESAEKLSIGKGKITQDKLKTILETFGLSEEKKINESNGVTFYGTENVSLLVDNLNNFVEYSRNVTTKKDFAGGTDLPIDTIKNKMIETVKSIWGDNGWQVIPEERGYKKLIYPRVVTANEKEAEMIDLAGKNSVNNIPILTYTGEMVEATYGLNGVLIRMAVQLPPTITKTGKTNTLMTLAQLKNRSTTKYLIWKVEGGKNFDLIGPEDVIKRVNATDVSLSYIYDQKETMWPYYLVTGNSFPESGPVKVTLITSAIDETQN